MGTCADNGLGTGMSAAEGAPSTYEKTYNRNLLSKRGKCWVAILDRDFLPHRLGKERNRSSKVLVFAIILIAVLMLAAIAGLIGQIGDSKEPLRSDTPVRIPARIAYTTHSPILIIGNGGFTNESGVVWGSGTESDPYIIEGWDINSSTANGIDLQNTYAHFTVRACHVHDGGLSYYGVSLFNCVNGTLENNHCSNNVCGIRLYSGSNNNTLNNNNCSDNSDGIAVSSGKNNTISNNTCCSNNVYGIVLTWSSDSTLSNNTCYSNNECGIYLFYSSSSNPLSNNTCSNNGYGIYLHSSSDSTLSNNTCSNNGYGIVLAWSSDSTLSNNTCSSNNVYGIHLYYSSGGNTLSNNTCSSNNVYGIFLYSSSGNTLNNNTCVSNGWYGVYLFYSSNNRIWNNTFYHNNGAGDAFDPLHIQAYDDGLNNWWNSTDGYGNYWSDWTAPDVVPPYGIVDVPYDIAGSAGAKDYYPLTTPQAPIPEFGMMPFVVMVLLATTVLTMRAWRRKAQ